MEQTIGNLIFHFEINERARNATIYKVESTDGALISIEFPEYMMVEGRRYTITSIKGIVERTETVEEYQYVERDRRRKTYGQTFTRQSSSFSTSCYSVVGNGEDDGELCSVKLPKSLRRIGDYAFYGCPLSFIEIPNTVRYIGSHAFYKNHFREVIIPESVTEIGSYAFWTRTSSVVVKIQNKEDKVKVWWSIVNDYNKGEVRYKGLKAFAARFFGKWSI